MVREHRLKPVAVLVTHGHVDHMWCVAPVAGTYDATAWIHPRRPAPAGQPDGRHERRDDRRCCSAASTSSPSRTRVEELADGQDLELAGLRFTVDHTPGHTRGSVTFRSPYDEQDISEVMFSGDLLFQGSIGRTDLPGGDHPDDAAEPAHQGAHAARRHRRAARPRRADVHRSRARDQPLPAGAPDRRSRGTQGISQSPEDCERLVQAHAAERLSRVPACRACRRARGRRVAVAHLRAARLRQHRDPRRRAPRPPVEGRRDRQGALRPAPAARRRLRRRLSGLGPALRPDGARSPATCWRTPASWSSPSAATRSSRPGAASGRRKAATASSPRPTSTSWAATTCRSTTTSRWCG